MSSSSEPPEDGPLFRAILRSLENRAHSLRKSIKNLLSATTASLSALQSNSQAQSLVDESLEALSLSSSTSKSDVLGGLYDNSLRVVRNNARIQREKDIRELIELNGMLKGSLERLKSLDSPKKTFEDSSKVYYDSVGKYLAKSESDLVKAASADSKQSERHTRFEALRIDYYSMVESLVESEEVTTATLLKVWSGVPEDTSLTTSKLEESRRKSRHQQHSSVARTLSASITYRDIAAGVFDSDEESDAEDSRSGGSGFSQINELQSSSRKRRSSIPSFSADPLKEKEPERKRDRLKIFLKHSLGSTSNNLFDPPRSPTLIETPRSPPLGETSPSIPFPSTSSPPLPSSERTTIPPPTPKQELASQARKKEGFLWSTTKSISHTASGDGGGHYYKLWCVLSEGQLIEFSGWKSALVVAGPPLNLKYATARISRNTDRRFVFEVITQSSRRVYQALNDEDVADWVQAINKSIESLLNGTSSVRHFDASRLTGSSTPYSLHDFGSTTSLVSRHHSSTSEPVIQSIAQSTAGALIDRLPSWMAPTTNHISRKTSISGGKKSKDTKNLAPIVDLSRVARTPSPRRPTVSSVTEPSGSQSQSRSGSSILDSSLSSSSDSQNIRNSAISTTTLASTSSSKINEQHSVASSEHDQRIEELVFDLAGPILSPEDILNKKMKNAGMIHELAELKENSTCAECSKGDSDWTSWNLGIFLCIRCSGIHRSLGTHISKVRSVELDDWSDEQVAAMRSVGNAKAREFWEARRPDGIVVDDQSVTAFIKQKYLERLWIPLSASTDSTISSSPDVVGVASTESSKPTDILSGVLKAVGIGL